MAMEENKIMTTVPVSDKHYTARIIERAYSIVSSPSAHTRADL